MELYQYYSSPGCFPSKCLYKWITLNDYFSLHQTASIPRTIQRDVVYQMSGMSSMVSSSISPTIVKRYNWFKTYDLWMESLKTPDCPFRMELGPWVVVNKTEEIEAKDFAFDIDINDFLKVSDTHTESKDETQWLRTCCQGQKICNKCWILVACGAKQLEYILQTHFGWTNLLFVFSGGRGIHIWVGHKSALHLSSTLRQYILQFIQNYPKTHDTTELVKTILLPHVRLFQKMQTNYVHNNIHQKAKEMNERELASYALKYFFVRVDEAVTKSLRHALKMPFCIHDSTFKVCIPISSSDITSFNVESSPILDTVAECESTMAKSHELINKWVDGFVGELAFGESDSSPSSRAEKNTASLD